MCGIVGYVGTPAAADREYTALDVILEGLRRLEYRGYDSAGVAVIADGRIEARKKAGKVSQLDAELAAHPLPDAVNGIGHTRWATHGGPTDVNAHPHVVADGRLAVVHNGIIENFSELRTELTGKGYEFVSETDTEVAATLLAEIYAHEAEEDLTRAMQLTCQRLEGAFTLLGRLDEKGRLTLDELRIDESVLRSVDKIVVIACGTAAYAGQVARYAIEHWCRIPTEVELAHEFRYRDPIVNEKTLVVALSQSGETMDTIMAVRHAREQGAKVIAICNTNGSSIPRESDASLYTHAGPEIAVASTKAFLAQITAAYLLGLYLAQLRGNMYSDEIKDVLEELQAMPEKVQAVIDAEEQVKKLGTDMVDAGSVLFLGRHVGFPVALEGALKLKEIAYIHAEGFAAGELKHGPIALVEEGQPVFVIVPSPRGRDSLHAKVVSNIQEIRARGAITIVIAEEGDDAVEQFANHVIRIPQAPTLMQPLLATVPLQIFACAMAAAKGYDVDQPRNLAKSVTVE